MHGRLKVKSTAEQQEAKRKEREKKLKLYNGATSKIFQKKKDGQLDEELLALTGEVLAVNPDFYTLWNFRKETFLELQKSKSSEELQSMFQNELFFLESCLKINPKSYGTWHHRCFVLDTMPKPDWQHELQLCNQFLTYDERNFHCWDYRRFMVKRADIQPEAEFEFSMSKISNNFSNYSSWHYRSKLLPLIHPDPTQPMGVTEDAMLQEYELVQNGIFTDPDDQSNWFYHRWLMGRGEQKQMVSSLHVSRTDSRVILSLGKHVQLGPKCRIQVEVDEKSLDDGLEWSNHLGNKTFSTTWATNNVHLPEGACSIKVTVVENGESCCCVTLQLEKAEECSLYQPSDYTGASRFSQELSAVKTETLQQELESINQLVEMETDNKWAALTVILLMKALDPIKYHQDIMAHITNLEALDFKRINYYQDLRSKFIIENAVDKNLQNLNTSSNHDGLDLSLKGQGLTTFCHMELMPFVRRIDLSSNQLTQVRHFGHLQNVSNLCLDDNQIKSCEGLGHMERLENLSLKNNQLSTVEDLTPLQHCPRLVTLTLIGNPICDNEASVQGLSEILPNVKIVSSDSSS